jgi:hypothetical protein
MSRSTRGSRGDKGVRRGSSEADADADAADADHPAPLVVVSASFTWVSRREVPNRTGEPRPVSHGNEPFFTAR